jgi:anion-transporting  ArsA/GET3 family ATPase
MSQALDQLLDRRILLVTGKGGTGKTTLAAVIGRLGAQRGLETVVVEIGDDPAVLPLLTDDPESLPPCDGRNPVPVAPHLYAFQVDPLEALTEYLELQFYVRPIVSLVTRNRGFRRLLDAAPGWRELITLGKIWHLATRQTPEGTPRWDLLIVDAPATGHGLSFISVPRVVLETVRMGPLRRHTDWVQGLITDPTQTLVVPVTLAEELPVRETLELCEGVRDLGLTVGLIVANAVEKAPQLENPSEWKAWLEQVPKSQAPRGLPIAVLLECMDHALRRAALHASFVAELQKTAKEPVLQLPALAGGVQRVEQVSELASALEQALARSGAIA